MNKKIDKFVPVMFQKINTYEAEDTRFLKVKIWLMHTEENLNGSYFDKSVVEAAIPSLANTPILAYVENNSEEESDFSDHRMVLVKKEGKYDIKYMGQAIGVIPQDNNAQFEKRVCDDGIEREFLTVDGLVWTKFDDPIEIFNRDTEKAQSMELHDNYEGEWGEDGLFHFTKFSFYGACALGKDVLPAMRSATIETQFSSEAMFNDIQTKMEQFKTLFSKEGGKELVDEKLELLKKFSLTEESVKEHDINLEDYSLEDLENKLIEITSTNNQAFSLTGEQLVQELNQALCKETTKDYWGDEVPRYSYVDYKENEVYAIDRAESYKLVGFEFEVSGDAITINYDSKKRKKIDFVDFEEDVEDDFSFIPKEFVEYEVKVAEAKTTEQFNKEKEDLQQNFSKVNEELESLREFKNVTLANERKEKETELFSSFSSELNEDEMHEIKESASNYSIEELEEKLFTLVGKKKAKFSAVKKDKNSSIKIPVSKEEDKPLPYGGLFTKYSG